MTDWATLQERQCCSLEIRLGNVVDWKEKKNLKLLRNGNQWVQKKFTGPQKRGRENSQCSLIKNKATILHTPKMNSQIPGLKNYQK